MREMLPTYLIINDIKCELRTDYRYGLTVMHAFNDPELTDFEKVYITVKILFKNIPDGVELNELYEKAVWFLDCGNIIDENADVVKPSKALYDWEQDEQMIFSAINKVAGKEVRLVEYMHWWTFIGLFNEIGEGVFSTILSIRSKKQKGKKLDKWEREYYRNNKSKIDLQSNKKRRSEDEQDAINKALGI